MRGEAEEELDALGLEDPGDRFIAAYARSVPESDRSGIPLTPAALAVRVSRGVRRRAWGVMSPAGKGTVVFEWPYA